MVVYLCFHCWSLWPLICVSEFEDEDEDGGGGCGVVNDEFGCVSDEGKKTCKEKCVVEMKPVWKN